MRCVPVSSPPGGFGSHPESRCYATPGHIGLPSGRILGHCGLKVNADSPCCQGLRKQWHRRSRTATLGLPMSFGYPGPGARQGRPRGTRGQSLRLRFQQLAATPQRYSRLPRESRGHRASHEVRHVHCHSTHSGAKSCRKSGLGKPKNTLKPASEAKNGLRPFPGMPRQCV
jgi:hypothetical protein